MLPIELALLLKQINNAFITCTPEVLDFTDNTKSSLLIISQSEQIIHIPLITKDLYTTISLLNAAFFQEKDATIISWNLKNYFSFIKFHTNSSPELNCKLFELKALEHYNNINLNVPKSFKEAATRLKTLVKDDNWKKTYEIYRKVHLPLSTLVLPDIETTPIYHLNRRIALYSHFEVEGQDNGRLTTRKAYKRSYVPHSMGPEEQEAFRPHAQDVFMLFDIAHMEVSMLQWLSKDERLKEVLELDMDFYKVVFKLVSGGDCDTEAKRETAKKFFLPVVFGMSAATLALDLKISVETAQKIISRIYKLFQTALEWVRNAQETSENPCFDIFGRKRSFEDRQHRIRNFVIQSPAALLCLEKLIALHTGLVGYARLICHIHDGYLVSANKKLVRTVALIGKNILESETELCPGLKLKAKCKFGPNLKTLEEI